MAPNSIDVNRINIADQFCTEQDMPVRPSPHVASEGSLWTVVTIHCIAVQQVADYWLLSIRVQASTHLSAAEEERVG